MEVREFFNQLADVIEKNNELKTRFEEKISKQNVLSTISDALTNGVNDWSGRDLINKFYETNKWFGFSDPPMSPEYKTAAMSQKVGGTDPMYTFTARTWEGRSDLFITLKQKLRQMIYAFIHEGADSPDYYLWYGNFINASASDLEVFKQKWYAERVLGRDSFSLFLFSKEETQYSLNYSKENKTWSIEEDPHGKPTKNHIIANASFEEMQKCFDSICKEKINVLEEYIEYNQEDTFDIDASEIHYLSKSMKNNLRGRKATIRKMFELYHQLDKVSEVESIPFYQKCEEELGVAGYDSLMSKTSREEQAEIKKKVDKYVNKKKQEVYKKLTLLLCEESRFWWD